MNAAADLAGADLAAVGLLAAGPSSAPVTHLVARLGWSALLVAGVVGVALLMLRGWRSRADRQGEVPPLPEPPEDHGVLLLERPVEAVYVSTTTSGNWLDRVVAHGLGTRAAADVTITTLGVWIALPADRLLWIPRSALRAVCWTGGMAGKVVGTPTILVLTWQHGDLLLDTGLHSASVADREALYDAAASLLVKENT